MPFVFFALGNFRSIFKVCFFPFIYFAVSNNITIFMCIYTDIIDLYVSYVCIENVQMGNLNMSSVSGFLSDMFVLSII